MQEYSCEMDVADKVMRVPAEFLGAKNEECEEIGDLLDSCLNAFSGFSSDSELGGSLTVLPPPSQVMITEFSDDSDSTARLGCNAPVVRIKRTRPADAVVSPLWESCGTISQAGYSSEKDETVAALQGPAKAGTEDYFENLLQIDAYMHDVIENTPAEQLFPLSRPDSACEISTRGAQGVASARKRARRHTQPHSN
mmetsp:Transcript_6313/g.16840  ORF Transcript_6313/g.16840 Transcript_6313/m.16840 type:complete len:196 (+) Transcript_6313:254-841(+)